MQRFKETLAVGGASSPWITLWMSRLNLCAEAYLPLLQAVSLIIGAVIGILAGVYYVKRIRED